MLCSIKEDVLAGCAKVVFGNIKSAPTEVPKHLDKWFGIVEGLCPEDGFVLGLGYPTVADLAGVRARMCTCVCAYVRARVCFVLHVRVCVRNWPPLAYATVLNMARAYMPFGAAFKWGKYTYETNHPKMAALVERTAEWPRIKEYLASSKSLTLSFLDVDKK